MKQVGEHPISVVVKKTGLSTHTIRAWEKRYGAVSPSRTSGNQRLYSDEDIDRLLLLKFAILSGRKIGQIAQLPKDKLLEYINSGPVTAYAKKKDINAHPEESSLNEILKTCMNAVLRLDAKTLEDSLTRASISFGKITVIEKIVVPLLKDIGAQWHEGSLRVMNEHSATGVIRTFLGTLLLELTRPDAYPAAVAATPVREQHEFGSLICAVAAAADGWDVKYLGPDIPAEEIVKSVQMVNARAVILSIILSGENPLIRSDLMKLSRFLPDHITLFIGGSGSGDYTHILKATNIKFMNKINEFRTALTILRSRT
jgi:DNA-binding transcriptional MerR regulator/methylmalonyl-CoA mutase cobalamin-binding subunit